MARHTILQEPGTRNPARLEQFNNIIGALLRKHGLTAKHKSVEHTFERKVLSALGCLAGQLSTNGLRPGEELKPTGTDAPLTHVLDTYMFPEEVELVMKLGLFRGEARN